MNKIVKGKQYTITWNSNNLIMLHVDSDIVSSIMPCIDAEYGNIPKMTITQGKIHKYLRININYSSSCKVKLYMVGYIVKMIDNIPEDMRGESETPAAHHLFDTSEDVIKLSQTDADLLHNFLAKLL